jgi:hypothetical protein
VNITIEEVNKINELNHGKQIGDTGYQANETKSIDNSIYSSSSGKSLGRRK